ncbi:MAG: 16S rRNA (guanine(527)-N(7))-methyltransferase RsmG [Rhodospirillales bacterium]|nr:16S rRNA (guanine(527)-N(7))-methyltransferase RsmG [Rhodospirillales bacterium]
MPLEIKLTAGEAEDRRECAARLERLGVQLSADQWSALERYVALLIKWQRAINLVAPSTLSTLWTRHVLDSLQIVPLIPANVSTSLDLGSGAGFPGVPVSIARPDIRTTLVESDTRKATFLAEVARVAAPGIIVRSERIEAIRPGTVDLVTARALAPLPKLLEWAFPATDLHTICLFHKGARLDEELTAAAGNWMMDVDRVGSVTEPAAAILRIRHLQRRA